MPLTQAIFLDKDGTIVDDVPYNVDPSRIQLARGVVSGLKLLSEAGYELIMVSNQSGLAWNRFDEQQLQLALTHITQLLAEHGVALDAMYYCPHHPSGTVTRYAVACDCRKPSPGMFLRAAEERRVDLQRSWMIGDILDDIQAAHRAGCRGVLINNGNETVWELGPQRVPDYVASNVEDAACWILQADDCIGTASRSCSAQLGIAST